MIGKDKNTKKKKKMEILNTPLSTVILETLGGIAGTTTQRTVLIVYCMSMALLL